MVGIAIFVKFFLIDIAVVDLIFLLLGWEILLGSGKLVGAADDLAVVAREPASDTVDDAIPPSALELGYDLDDVALVEAETCPVVRLVVVERPHVHGTRWRRAHDAVHEG